MGGRHPQFVSSPTWSMKIAGAPLGNGPIRCIGSRTPWSRSCAMISTRISPIVRTLMQKNRSEPA